MMKLSLINGKMRKDKGCIVSFQKAELFHLKDSPLCAIDYFFPFLVLTYFFSYYIMVMRGDLFVLFLLRSQDSLAR